MNKKKIELQVLNISNSQAQAGAYAMVLGEINGMRQLPVIIGSAEAQSMMIEMRGIVPPRPLTHTLFASVLKVLGATLLRVLIYKVDNGVFYSYLYMKTEETILRIDARTSDAVALALRMDAPIFIYDDILEAECLKTEHSITPTQQTDDAAADAATRKKTLKQQLPPLRYRKLCPSTRKKTLKQLKEALQNAIDEEDYERAAQLRDIINQHKKP